MLICTNTLYVRTRGSGDSCALIDWARDRFEYENYLDIVPFDLRYFLLRLRVSSHSIRKQDVMEMIGYHVMNVFVFTVI